MYDMYCHFVFKRYDDTRAIDIILVLARSDEAYDINACALVQLAKLVAPAYYLVRVDQNRSPPLMSCR